MWSLEFEHSSGQHRLEDLSLPICRHSLWHRMDLKVLLIIPPKIQAGNWSNQDPLPWMGAYHSSDLVMLFGTYQDGEGPVLEPLEAKTSETMEDFVFAFLSDPYNGPPSMGWMPFDSSASNGGTMLRFGAGGQAVQNVSANNVEAVCFGTGPYDPFPT